MHPLQSASLAFLAEQRARLCHLEPADVRLDQTFMARDSRFCMKLHSEASRHLQIQLTVDVEQWNLIKSIIR